MGFSAFQTISSSKTSGRIRENVVSGEFAIAKPKAFPFLKYNGVFPRSVQIGEVLFTSDVLTIVSPVSGYAKISEENEDIIQINLNGMFLPKAIHSREVFSQKGLIDKILEFGNSTLDFPGRTLVNCIQDFLGKEGSSIIFSPFTKDNFIDYRSKILEEFSAEFELFKTNLSDIFPKSKISTPF